jgi:aminoglycoside phosphotransferase (APT) family kinase protein
MIAAEILAAVPGLENGRPPLATELLADSLRGNRVWRLVTPEGRFVLRQRQAPIDRPGSLAAVELASHRVAASAGLAPALLTAAADGSWMVMENLIGGVWTEARLLSESGIAKLAAVLRKLYTLQPPAAMQPLDAAAVARDYLQQAVSWGRPIDATLRALPERVAALSARLADIEGGAVLSHGDLSSGNILGRLPKLIDWEYAQLAGPTYDIACLLTYYPILEARRHDLMQALGLDPAHHEQALTLQQQRFACLDGLWKAIHTRGAG